MAKIEKDDASKPIFYLSPYQAVVEEKVKEFKTVAEKIEFLNAVISHYPFDEAFKYFQTMSENRQIPPVWRGILSAREGKQAVNTSGLEDEASAIEDGKWYWDQYCRYKQIKFDLEHGTYKEANKPSSDKGVRHRTAKYGDPFSYIDPLMKALFETAEKRALAGKDAFPSTIRCAAFCEYLYEKKYIIRVQKNNRIQIANFASARYGIDIYPALADGKKANRKSHINSTIGSHPPLKRSF